MGIGMAKTGLGGLGMVVVPVMANIFGAKSSTGILLLFLIMADFFGVRYYHMHADMRQLVKLIPSTIIGILTGVMIGDVLSDENFRLLLAGVIIAGAVMMIIKVDIKENKISLVGKEISVKRLFEQKGSNYQYGGLPRGTFYFPRGTLSGGTTYL